MDGRGRSDEKTRTEEYRWNSSVVECSTERADR